MHIAILTFEGFNELDSIIALGILNRIRKPDWRVSIACPAPRVRSMNGVGRSIRAIQKENPSFRRLSCTAARQMLCWRATPTESNIF